MQFQRPFLLVLTENNKIILNSSPFKERRENLLPNAGKVSSVHCTRLLRLFDKSESRRLLLVYNFAYVIVKVSVKQLCTCFIQFVGAFLA